MVVSTGVGVALGGVVGAGALSATGGAGSVEAVQANKETPKRTDSVEIVRRLIPPVRAPEATVSEKSVRRPPFFTLGETAGSERRMLTMRPVPWIPLLALLLYASACSSEAPGAPGATNGDAGVSAEAEAPCGPPPGRVSDEGAQCVREVSGVVRDMDGVPLPDLTVSVCGLACFAALSAPNGSFSIPVNARLPDGGYVVSAHGRPTFGGVYVRLPAGPAERLVLPPIELPRLSDGAVDLPKDGSPASVVRVGPLSFGVAAETKWELELEDLVDDVAGRRVRFAAVAETKAPPFAKGAARVYALAPFKAKASKPMSVTVHDAVGFAPGTAVDFVVMQDDIVSAKNTGGLPVIAAKGHVSDDGTRIDTDPGQGIDRLTWLAIRPSR